MRSQLLRALTAGHVCHFAQVIHMDDSPSLSLCPRVCLSHTKSHTGMHSQVEQEQSCSGALLYFESVAREHM